MSNYYFCTNCVSAWSNKTFMSCCSGCKEHESMGWSPNEMLSVYEPLIKRYGRAYFPSLYRNKAPDRKPFNVYNDFSKALLWLNTDTTLLPGYVSQQKKCIEMYQREPNEENWEVIDPSVQDKIVIKILLKFRY